MIRVYLFLFLAFSSLFAHKLSLFTNMENNQLYVSTYFASGKPCKTCGVKIISMDNKIVNEYKVNKKGEINTKIELERFLLRVDAGSGHVETKLIVNKNKKKQKEENQKLEELKKENLLLKSQIKSLEEKLNYFEIFKIVFGLLIIFVIFYVLKKVKK